MGGYIPAPSRGTLDVQAITPDAKPGRGWLDTDTGNLYRWSTDLNDWSPVGEPSPSLGYQALLLGRATVKDGSSSAFGVGVGAAKVDGYGAIAIGNEAQALGYQNLAIGAGATITGSASSAIAIGPGTNADDAGGAIVLGYFAKAHDSNCIAIGYQTESGGPGRTGGSSLAIGYEARAEGGNHVVIGYGAYIDTPAGGGSAYNALAVGYEAHASGEGGGAAAFGYWAHAGGMRAVAIGNTAKALANDSVAIGNGAEVTTVGDGIIGVNNLEVAGTYGPESALILHDATGARWRLSISDAGAVVVTAAV